MVEFRDDYLWKKVSLSDGVFDVQASFQEAFRHYDTSKISDRWFSERQLNYVFEAGQQSRIFIHKTNSLLRLRIVKEEDDDDTPPTVYVYLDTKSKKFKRIADAFKGYNGRFRQFMIYPRPETSYILLMEDIRGVKVPPHCFSEFRFRLIVPSNDTVDNTDSANSHVDDFINTVMAESNSILRSREKEYLGKGQKRQRFMKRVRDLPMNTLAIGNGASAARRMYSKRLKFGLGVNANILSDNLRQLITNKMVGNRPELQIDDRYLRDMYISSNINILEVNGIYNSCREYLDYMNKILQPTNTSTPLNREWTAFQRCYFDNRDPYKYGFVMLRKVRNYRRIGDISDRLKKVVREERNLVSKVESLASLPALVQSRFLNNVLSADVDALALFLHRHYTTEVVLSPTKGADPFGISLKRDGNLIKVFHVAKNSAANKAGIQVGDIITHISDDDVPKNHVRVAQLIKDLEPGEFVMKVQRYVNTENFTVRKKLPADTLGVTFISDGVSVRVSKVEPGSVAESAGVQAGDVFTHINGIDVPGSAVAAKNLYSQQPQGEVDLMIIRAPKDERKDPRSTIDFLEQAKLLRKYAYCVRSDHMNGFRGRTTPSFKETTPYRIIPYFSDFNDVREAIEDIYRSADERKGDGISPEMFAAYVSRWDRLNCEIASYRRLKDHQNIPEKEDFGFDQSWYYTPRRTVLENMPVQMDIDTRGAKQPELIPMLCLQMYFISEAFRMMSKASSLENKTSINVAGHMSATKERLRSMFDYPLYDKENEQLIGFDQSEAYLATYYPDTVLMQTSVTLNPEALFKLSMSTHLTKSWFSPTTIFHGVEVKERVEGGIYNLHDKDLVVSVDPHGSAYGILSPGDGIRYNNLDNLGNPDVEVEITRPGEKHVWTLETTPPVHNNVVFGIKRFYRWSYRRLMKPFKIGPSDALSKTLRNGDTFTFLSKRNQQHFAAYIPLRVLDVYNDDYVKTELGKHKDESLLKTCELSRLKNEYVKDFLKGKKTESLTPSDVEKMLRIFRNASNDVDETMADLRKLFLLFIIAEWDRQGIEDMASKQNVFYQYTRELLQQVRIGTRSFDVFPETKYNIFATYHNDHDDAYNRVFQLLTQEEKDKYYFFTKGLKRFSPERRAGTTDERELFESLQDPLVRKIHYDLYKKAIKNPSSDDALKFLERLPLTSNLNMGLLQQMVLNKYEMGFRSSSALLEGLPVGELYDPNEIINIVEDVEDSELQGNKKMTGEPEAVVFKLRNMLEEFTHYKAILQYMMPPDEFRKIQSKSLHDVNKYFQTNALKNPQPVARVGVTITTPADTDDTVNVSIESDSKKYDVELQATHYRLLFAPNSAQEIFNLHFNDEDDVDVEVFESLKYAYFVVAEHFRQLIERRLQTMQVNLQPDSNRIQLVTKTQVYVKEVKDPSLTDLQKGDVITRAIRGSKQKTDLPLTGQLLEVKLDGETEVKVYVDASNKDTINGNEFTPYIPISKEHLWDTPNAVITRSQLSRSDQLMQKELNVRKDVYDVEEPRVGNVEDEYMGTEVDHSDDTELEPLLNAVMEHLHGRMEEKYEEDDDQTYGKAFANSIGSVLNPLVTSIRSPITAIGQAYTNVTKDSKADLERIFHGSQGTLCVSYIRLVDATRAEQMFDTMNQRQRLTVNAPDWNAPFTYPAYSKKHFLGSNKDRLKWLRYALYGTYHEMMTSLPNAVGKVLYSFEAPDKSLEKLLRGGMMKKWSMELSPAIVVFPHERTYEVRTLQEQIGNVDSQFWSKVVIPQVSEPQHLEIVFSKIASMIDKDSETIELMVRTFQLSMNLLDYNRQNFMQKAWTQFVHEYFLRKGKSYDNIRFRDDKLHQISGQDIRDWVSASQLPDSWVIILSDRLSIPTGMKARPHMLAKQLRLGSVPEELPLNVQQQIVLAIGEETQNLTPSVLVRTIENVLNRKVYGDQDPRKQSERALVEQYEINTSLKVFIEKDMALKKDILNGNTVSLFLQPAEVEPVASQEVTRTRTTTT